MKNHSTSENSSNSENNSNSENSSNKTKIRVQPIWSLLPRSIVSALILIVGFLGPVTADPGVLIPENLKSVPDPSILSLDDMNTQIDIRDNFAMVRIRQIFRSHHSGEIEGKYIFRIPPGALISAFAVWDGMVRIPGIIMEKTRARKVYDEITARKIDPGILESSDESNEPGHFSCRVFPIPPYGTKRLEISFNMLLPVDNGAVKFILPFSPASFETQKAGRCAIRVSLESNGRVRNSSVSFGGVTKLLARPVSFDLRNAALDSDLTIDYDLDASETPVSVVTHPFSETEGYFMATAITSGQTVEALHPASAKGQGSAKPGIDLVIAIDTSFSVQWEKLEMTLEAVSRLISFLSPEDNFDLVVFSDAPSPAFGRLRAGSAANTSRAMTHLMSTQIEGGTDIAAAISRGAEILSLGAADNAPKGLDNVGGTHRPRVILLISDGSPTSPGPDPARVTEAAAKAVEAYPGLRIFAFGLGDEVNTVLMGKVAALGRGHFEWCPGYGDVEYKTMSLASKMGTRPFGRPRFDWGLSTSDVYSRCGDNFGLNGTVPTVFPGQGIHFFGKYAAPRGASPEWKFSADFEGGAPLLLTGEASPAPPIGETSHVARLWAKARVDFLIERQRLEGENENEIEEIIKLSRKFSFVTPYTAFLAAPRALLRPRIIQPGDPVIKVRTNPEIERVEALFPFGESKAMHRVAPDQWELRFLAPSWLDDGRHEVSLVLTDRNGRVYRETKWFIIDSSAPKLKVMAGEGPFVAGGRVPLKAYACPDTRRIRAWLPGVPPVDLRYSHGSKASEGTLTLPAGIGPGKKEIRVVAEDFAKNLTVTTLDLDILPAGGVDR